MEEQEINSPMIYTAKFWFSGLENAVEFRLVEEDYERLKNYLSNTKPKEFFEFDTPEHTVVLANMVEVDALKLFYQPALDDLETPLEEPSEAIIQLVGREDPFTASTSEEHLGPKHPVRKLLNVRTDKFIHWLNARGHTVVVNPKKLSYIEHPKYWLEEQEDWADEGAEAEAEAEVVAAE